MPRIIPINQLKNTAEVSSMVHEDPAPIYVTKNGYGDMVLQDVEAYEALCRKVELYRSLAISEAEIKEGKVKDAEVALEELAKRYGL